MGPKRGQTNKGFSLETGTDHVLTVTRVRTRQRLDPKQEPKYTEPNKTQVDMTRQMRTENTERDTGEDNDRETLGQGKTKNRGARLWL